jgi:hypothetical protein
VVMMDVSAVAELWLDADKSGEGVAWLRLEI